MELRTGHTADCNWLTPLPTGEGYYGCSCGYSEWLIENEDLMELSLEPDYYSRVLLDVREDKHSDFFKEGNYEPLEEIGKVKFIIPKGFVFPEIKINLIEDSPWQTGIEKNIEEVKNRENKKEEKDEQND